MGLDEVVVGIPTSRDLTDLSVPGELGVVALESPKAVRADGKAPHLLRLAAPLLHGVDVLPHLPVPLLWVLHHPADQILRELHYERHLLSKSV